MATPYEFKVNSNHIIPITEAEAVIDDMSTQYSTGHCYIQFFSDDGITSVTPSGGTITFYVSPFNETVQWHPSADGSIDATTVGNDESAYIPITFETAVAKTKLVLSGDFGDATHYRAIHWRT